MADSQRKTYNLFDSTTLQNNTGIGADGLPYPYNNRIASYTPVNISSNAVTLSFVGDVKGIYSLFDETDTLITRTANVTSGTTIDTTGAVKMYLCFYQNNATVTTDNVTDIMLNSGSQPLPYEPYGWLHSLRKLTTATDTITTLPADLYADGTNASADILGNMSQSGTPTPQNPIQPSECGERTGNLFDGTLIGSAFSSASFTVYSNLSTDVFKSIKVYLPAGTYTISWGKNVNVLRQVIDGVWSQIDNVINVSEYTFTCTTDDYYGISFRDTTSGTTDWDNTTPIMLNSGSTALPYQPYGYKLDIKSANTTTPVYLGQVETTRKIKKVVYDGTETSWYRIETDGRYIYYNDTISPDYLHGDEVTVVCSHYKAIANVTSGGAVGENETAMFKTPGANQRVYFGDSRYTTVDDWKAYLAQQYAAGTPVCVWYVLATPTTGIVNEPLRKIGDYADSVSVTGIPTITGKDTFDVLTTLKPSEVELTYTGWHDAMVKEWDGSEWQ